MLKLTNSLCEALICGDWHLIPVEALQGDDSFLIRCPECRASIKLVQEAKDGQHAHFDHAKRNPECTLGNALGKKLKYVHSPVKITETDREESAQFEQLLPQCVASSAVINFGEASEDIMDLMDLSSPDAEKQLHIDARLGQGQFKQAVIDVWGNEACALTLTPVKEMLVASHIKAWRNCDDAAERLDGANGILLCAHIDRLFSSHQITFRKVGHEFRLKMAESLDKSLMAQFGVNEGDALATGRMHKADADKFEDFLSHHGKVFCHLNDINSL